MLSSQRGSLALLGSIQNPGMDMHPRPVGSTRRRGPSSILGQCPSTTIGVSLPQKESGHAASCGQSSHRINQLTAPPPASAVQRRGLMRVRALRHASQPGNDTRFSATYLTLRKRSCIPLCAASKNRLST